MGRGWRHVSIVTCSTFLFAFILRVYLITYVRVTWLMYKRPVELRGRMFLARVVC